MKGSVKYIKNILSFVLTVAGIVFGIFIGIRFLGFFMPFVVGWIIALIANPLVRFLERRMKIVRKHSSMLIIIGVLALIIGGGYFAGVKLVENTGKMISQFPDMYNSINEDFKVVGNNIEGLVNKLPENIQATIRELPSALNEELGHIAASVSQWTVNSAGDMAKKLPNTLIMIIFTILSAYFFTADRDKILKFGREHIPVFIQEKWKLISDNFSLIIGGYFKAQFKIMFIVWIVLSVGFFMLEIKFAIFIAFLVAFLDMLPFFGTGTALGPWAIFKFLSGDPHDAIWLIVLYVITQLLRRILEPKLVGDSIGIDPLVTLAFMFIGYKLGSILGMILAVPIGAILVNFFKMGMFDNIIEGCREVVVDFYNWLKPQEKDMKEK